MKDLSEARFTIRHVGNELNLILDSRIDVQLPLSTQSTPAIWVRSKQQRGILSVLPGSTISR